MCDFDTLEQKYRSSQEECRKLKEKLSATEAELNGLQNVLGPALDEYGELRQRYHIEQGCRAEAEKYATKVKRQNRELKRRSQQLLAKMQTFDIALDVENSSPSESDSESNDTTLNSRIQSLETTVREMETQLATADADKLTAYEREYQLVAKVRCLEDELSDAQQQIEEFNKEMKRIKRVSSAAWQEFEELKEEHERLLQLQSEAEKYAHQMMSERDAVRRESSLLIESAVNDQRLAAALKTIEELTAKVSTEQLQHQQQIKALQKELDSTETSNQQISQLENRLGIVMSENESLRKSIKDLEKWKEKLEKENVDLVNKLDVAEQKLRPPPPPPPPPPSFLSPLKLLIKKQPASKAKTNTTKAGTPKDQTYEEALKEMMDRIKHGKALKPSAATEIPGRTKTDGESAMDNLQNILNRREGNSVDEVVMRRKQERKDTNKPEEEQTELMQTLERVRLKGQKNIDSAS